MPSLNSPAWMIECSSISELPEAKLRARCEGRERMWQRLTTRSSRTIAAGPARFCRRSALPTLHPTDSPSGSCGDRSHGDRCKENRGSDYPPSTGRTRTTRLQNVRPRSAAAFTTCKRTKSHNIVVWRRKSCSGGEGVSQSPLKDKAFLIFLDQNPPLEPRPEKGFRKSPSRPMARHVQCHQATSQRQTAVAPLLLIAVQ
jgi:hypothetical protein